MKHSEITPNKYSQKKQSTNTCVCQGALLQDSELILKAIKDLLIPYLYTNTNIKLVLPCFPENRRGGGGGLIFFFGPKDPVGLIFRGCLTLQLTGRSLPPSACLQRQSQTSARAVPAEQTFR